MRLEYTFSYRYGKGRKSLQIHIICDDMAHLGSTVTSLAKAVRRTASCLINNSILLLVFVAPNAGWIDYAVALDARQRDHRVAIDREWSDAAAVDADCGRGLPRAAHNLHLLGSRVHDVPPLSALSSTSYVRASLDPLHDPHMYNERMMHVSQAVRYIPKHHQHRGQSAVGGGSPEFEATPSSQCPLQHHCRIIPIPWPLS